MAPKVIRKMYTKNNRNFIEKLTKNDSKIGAQGGSNEPAFRSLDLLGATLPPKDSHSVPGETFGSQMASMNRITYAVGCQTKKHHIQKDKIWTENPGRACEGNFVSKTWISEKGYQTTETSTLPLKVWRPTLHSTRLDLFVPRSNNKSQEFQASQN